MATPIPNTQPNQDNQIENIRKRLEELADVPLLFKERELNDIQNQLQSIRYSMPKEYLNLRNSLLNQFGRDEEQEDKVEPTQEKEEVKIASPEELEPKQQKKTNTEEKEQKRKETQQEVFIPNIQTRQNNIQEATTQFDDSALVRQIQLQESELRKMANKLNAPSPSRGKKQDVRALQKKYDQLQQELFLNLQNMVDTRQQNYYNLQKGLISIANREGLQSQRTQEYLSQIQNYSNELDYFMRRYEQMKPNVSQGLVKEFNYTPEKRSDRLESAVASRIIKGNLKEGDPGDIDTILKSNDPLEVLGISENSDSLNVTELSDNYKDILTGLYISDDPRADEARQKLIQEVSPFIDALSQDDTRDRIIEKANYRKLRVKKTEKREKESQAKLTKANVAAARNEYADYDLNFSINNWVEDRKKDYYQKKREALKNLPVRTAVAIEGAYESKAMTPLRSGVAYAGKTRLGNWINTKISSGRNNAQGIGAKAKGMIKKLDNSVAEAIINKTNREVTIQSYTPRKRGYRLGRELSYTTSVRENYQKRREKKKGSSSLMALRTLYDMTIGRVVHTVKQVVSAAKDIAYTKTGLKALNNQSRALGSRISTKFWGGRMGKALITAQRGLNGLRALGRALPSGLSSSAMMGLALAVSGAGLPALPIIVAGAGGVGAKLLSDTLASKTPHFWKPIANLQQKYGYLNSSQFHREMNFVPGKDIINGSRGRLSSLLRSYNWGMYGMGIGSLIGAFLGNAALGAVIGTGAGLLTRYAIDRSANNILAKLGEKTWFTTLSRMPLFESIGLIQSIPWLNYQIDGFRKDFGNQLSKEWLVWKNPLLALGNLTNLGITTHSLYSIGAWASRVQGFSFARAGIGGGLGMLVGAIVLPYLGIPIGVGFVVGGTVGAVVGGAVGTFIPIPGIGTISGSFVGSLLGGTIGGFIDKLLGKVNVLEQLFGALSGIKGILDFIKALSERFDPMGALGLTLTLMFSLTYLAQMQFDEVHYDNSKIETQAAGGNSSAQDPKPVKPVLGEETKSETIDCLEQSDKTIINPATDIVTEISLDGKYYNISTNSYNFINILKPRRGIERQGTMVEGELVGTCRN